MGGGGTWTGPTETSLPEAAGMVRSSSTESEHIIGIASPLPRTVLREGQLRKQAQNFGRDWQRRYFVLTPGALLYFRDQERSEARCRIELVSATVKSMEASSNPHSARRFRLLTPTREYCLEAESEEEALAWMVALTEAIQDAIRSHSSDTPPQTSSSGALVIGCLSLAEEIRNIPDSGNDRCADCGAVLPTWVSVNFAVVLCIDCSGIHRSLGCQVSKVRSLDLDLFLPESIAVLKKLGNRRMNAIWEMEQPVRPCATARRIFIEDKYLRRLFTGEHRILSPLAAQTGPSSLFSPAQALFESVTREDLVRTAELLFRHSVDPNITNGIDGSTPLHHAAASGQSLQAHFLLLNGANAVMRDGAGRIPSELALEAGHVHLAEHLHRYQDIAQRGGGQHNDPHYSLEETEAFRAQRIQKALDQM